MEQLDISQLNLQRSVKRVLLSIVSGRGAVKMFTPAFLDKYHPSPRRHAVDNPPGV